jgi:hypothetical protein
MPNQDLAEAATRVDSASPCKVLTRTKQRWPQDPYGWHKNCAVPLENRDTPIGEFSGRSCQNLARKNMPPDCKKARLYNARPHSICGPRPKRTSVPPIEFVVRCCRSSLNLFSGQGGTASATLLDKNPTFEAHRDHVGTSPKAPTSGRKKSKKAGGPSRRQEKQQKGGASQPKHYK